jgi:Ca2+-binding RTX toxin-like protein
VAPVITAHDNSSPSGSLVGENDTITVSGAFTDVGTLDTHTVMIDWGDGTVGPGLVDPATRTFAGQHAYAAGGIFTVTITLADDDLGVSTVIETVFVTGAGVQTIGGKQVLFVVGTNDADQVTINQVGSGATRVHADFLHDKGGHRTFDQPIDEIRVVLVGGDDHATIAGNVAIPALLDGGNGDDHLNAGAAGSVVIGGPGDDTLIGGRDNDILIGDDGRDRLIGNGGEDILIGGLTAFTDGPDDDILKDQISLFGILAEWTSDRGTSSRRANVSGVANPEFGNRLNGSNFLQLGGTLTDDLYEDVITGGSDSNWFFVFINDLVTDFKARQGDVKAV